MLTIDRTNKKSVREALGKALVEVGKNNNNVVVLDADLAGATKSGIFLQIRRKGKAGGKSLF